MRQSGRQRATADMDKAPSDPARQQCERLEQIIVSLLCHQSADREDDDGMLRIAAVRVIRPDRGRWKSREIDPVIAERDLIRARSEIREMTAPGLGTGDDPARFGELFALLPDRERPDILGVRRYRPSEAEHHSRVAR